MDKGAKVRAYDPEAMENIEAIYGDRITLCEDMYETLEESDVLAIVTEWNVFRTPDFTRIKELLDQPTIFDGRNLYDLEDMQEKGFNYTSIGRKRIRN